MIEIIGGGKKKEKLKSSPFKDKRGGGLKNKNRMTK
jgi:hypothetical protein